MKTRCGHVFDRISNRRTSHRLRDIPEHTIVVSTSGFTEDAIDYLKDEKSEIKPFDDKEESTVLDLIVEKRDGSYEVAYYG